MAWNASSSRWLCSFIGLTIAICLGAAFAEQRGPRLLEKQSQAQGRHSEHSIKVDVNLVLLSVTVTDRLGRMVDGLERANFRILEDGAQQQIVSFSQEDVPCSVGLLVDVSGSMRDKMAKAREAARAFLESANPQDEASLMTFSNRPSMEVGLTSDFLAIQNRLLFVKPGGSTALVDAVYLGLRQIRSARHARKALLVVSDGGDNNSRFSEKELRSFALEADAQIYAIGIHDNPRSREEMTGSSLLEDLTKATGGLHFVIRDLNELPDVAAKIGVALHDQYVIGYYPPATTVLGMWRRIQVKLQVPKGMPPLQVYARSGYYPPER